LAALVDGRTDPATMAELARGRLRSKLPLLEQALSGLVRDHHQQLLAMQLAHIDFLDAQIATLTTTIAERLSVLPPTETVAVPVAIDELAVRYRYGAWTQNISYDSPHASTTPDAPGVATRDHHLRGACPTGPDYSPGRRGHAAHGHCRHRRDQPPLCL
jgi:hypothetical protein